MEGVRLEEGRDTSSVEFVPELDESLDEHLLRGSDPVGYSWYVDGVRKVFVKDESINVRWGIRDGKSYLISLEVF